MAFGLSQKIKFAFSKELVSNFSETMSEFVMSFPIMACIFFSSLIHEIKLAAIFSMET
jgi:hypothetical protein